MKYKLISLEKMQTAFVVTLNEPEKGNSLSSKMLEELIHLFEQIRAGKVDFRALVLTAMGKDFSLGLDWDLVSQMERHQALEFFKKASTLGHEILNLPFPLIACVSGRTWGVGFELALNCDFIYSTQSAQFRFPEVNYGLIPGGGGCSRLVNSIGPGRAKEFIYTGECLSALSAQRLGIVNKVFESKDVMLTEALETVKQIDKKSPKALSLCKSLFGDILGYSKDAYKKEPQVFFEALHSQEKDEGMRAIKENREPRYDQFFLNQ